MNIILIHCNDSNKLNTPKKPYFCPMNLPSKGTPLIYVVLILGFVSLWNAGCYKEVFTSSTGDKLRFSLDTLRFDTVFVTVGSATRSFKIFNDAILSIRIEKIKIKSGVNSVFRLNVDGNSAPTKELSNIEIGPKDSIYVFLEATVQPDQPVSVSPFVIEDQIDFTTNGNVQTVHLEAWGQNANYIPNRYANGSLALLSCNLQEETWSDPKPYVIYGVLFIDSCTLRIPAGARVYVHGGLVRNGQNIYNDGIIYVLDHGKISVEGTVDKPVIFTTDRLEKELKDEWGAWSGIRIGQGSSGSRITYAEIRNAFVGVYADSSSDLTIRNTKIFNSASSGLIGVHAKIIAENCLFHSNGSHGIQFAYGGVYRVDYCTVASYENDAEAISMNNLLIRDPENRIVSFYPLVANVTNSIFFGSGRDEIDLADGKPLEPSFFQTSFANCYIKAEELLTPMNYPKFFETCAGCIQAKSRDTVFLNVAKLDFRLDTMSIVNNKAKPLDRLPFDFLGVRRDAVTPDMGCYELK
ncbi:MAG: right-handed parallel beta-helix repeat-containing protein [Saprospiraceae bacterium]